MDLTLHIEHGRNRSFIKVCRNLRLFPQNAGYSSLVEFSGTRGANTLTELLNTPVWCPLFMTAAKPPSALRTGYEMHLI
jgi:hypothetical protein